MGKTGALILAAGKGTRMNLDTPKQFLKWNGKPLYMYSVEKFLPFTDHVAVVTSEDRVEEIRKELEAFGLSEKTSVCLGGSERFQSSFMGLLHLKKTGAFTEVLIHDAARPFVRPEVIERVLRDVRTFGSGVAAVPSKDTVKIVDSEGFVKETPNRADCYIIQTPQGFSFDLIFQSFEKMFLEDYMNMGITDDAMVCETFSGQKIKLTLGDYENIKITTPEDLFRLK